MISEVDVKYFDRTQNLAKRSFDHIFDFVSATCKESIESESVQLVKPGGNFITTNGDFLNKIDNSNSLILGTTDAGCIYSTKKINFFKNYGVNYFWAFFDVNNQMLQRIITTYDSGLLKTNTIHQMPIEQYRSLLPDESDTRFVNDPTVKNTNIIAKGKVIFDI
eukprot:TRINITY_DN3274_c0_g1_i1.p1 TRINITY_DN3274_c0_g1~~TRINITY_DN3274_c0_g1_i1.p1  ORF type:complete len:164 (+),score=15.77 TRINITY_DN3274_c0_g1_i1:588-1079(+)